MKGGGALDLDIILETHPTPTYYHSLESLRCAQVRHLINAINEASEVIPGWPEYAKTGKAKELWDGKTFKDNPSMTSNYFS